MSNARNLSSLLESDGDVKTSALDNVSAPTKSTIDALGIAATSVTGSQASAITANTAKLTYPSADSTKLGGIETSATADQTNAEIKTAVEAATSIALGGSPTTTTQAESDDSTKVATTAYVTDKITTLIGGAPSTLNDLNELAAAINDDADYNSTLTTALATKLPLAGGTMTGDIALGDNVKAKFGASDDLEVYSDGTNSRITESGSGSLIIKGTQMLFQTGTGETTAYHTADGSVRLYHNNVPKIETTSTGIDVTGSVDASGVGKFGKPSDFWASTQAYYGGAYGNITTNGSWEYEMTCNGYRNTSAQWTSLATNSYTGATSISMNPQGHIRFCTDASKADGSDSDITERMRIDSAGDVTVNTGNLVIGTAGKGIDFGDWTITESSGVLKFATGGTNKMKLDASGNLTVVGNITAYGSI